MSKYTAMLVRALTAGAAASVVFIASTGCPKDDPIAKPYDCSGYYTAAAAYCADAGGVALAFCDPMTGAHMWPPTCAINLDLTP